MSALSAAVARAAGHTDALLKGAERVGHKYVRREPDGKGGWVYVYKQTLGVPRVEMPQLGNASGAVERFVAQLRAAGVEVTDVTAAVGNLKATQREANPDKIAGMVEQIRLGGEFAHRAKAPLLVSRDGYVLDGHHRWMALAEIDPKTQIPVRRIDLPVREALARLLASPEAERKPVEAKAEFAKAATGSERAGHKYVSRKATGEPNHPWAYDYGQPSTFMREALTHGERGGAQRDLFSGTDKAPPARSLADVAVHDVVKALKDWPTAEITPSRRRTGVTVRPQTDKWVEVAFEAWSIGDRGRRAAQERVGIGHVKAKLRAAGYTFDESRFGHDANRVLVGRFADQGNPVAGVQGAGKGRGQLGLF